MVAGIEGYKQMKAYHFVDENWELIYALKGTKVYEGMVTPRLEPPDKKIELCKFGYHASVKALDALQYASSGNLCIVEMSGEIIEGDDKVVATERTVIKMINIDRILHEFALWCAEKTLSLIPNPDPRSLKALEVKRLWLDGKATDKELQNARAAAWGARITWGARAVISAIAWDATIAARDTRDNTVAAAMDAWDTRDTRIIARDAALAAQNKMLEQMINDAIEGA